jgi:hypothetical protein
LTSKCASHHNSVHFFNISTSKSAPNARWLAHFDCEKCFAPQQRALFQHLNCEKLLGAAMFCAFSLRPALRPTTECIFWSPIWPGGSGATKHWENTAFPDFPRFSRNVIFWLLIFFLLTFFLLTLSLLCLLSPPLLHLSKSRKFDF